MSLVDLSAEIVFPGAPSSQRDGNGAPWQCVCHTAAAGDWRPRRVPRGVTATVRAPHEQATGSVTLTTAEEPREQGRARITS